MDKQNATNAPSFTVSMARGYQRIWKASIGPHIPLQLTISIVVQHKEIENGGQAQLTLLPQQALVLSM